MKETPKLNKMLMFLKIVAVVAPLMGLLGTVTGMIETFQSITLFGAGDPKLMAGGIFTSIGYHSARLMRCDSDGSHAYPGV